MVFVRRTTLLRYLLLSAMLALFLFISSLWLRRSQRLRRRMAAMFECSSANTGAITRPRAECGGRPAALIRDCPGQAFQTRRLLLHLKSSLSDDGDDDILMEPYLQSWDQLLSFMESLGTMVSFFSQKVNKKVKLIRELSAEAHGTRGSVDGAGGPVSSGAYHSVRSMVEAELRAGVVDFSRRTDSGCRTLLRLHRSLLWLKLVLQGLAEGPDTDGRYKTPGELSRDAYRVALAPHHHWVLRQAADLVFLALPDRRYFLQLVCVQDEEDAAPVLRVIIHALTLVHTRTQRILAQHRMLELP